MSDILDRVRSLVIRQIQEQEFHSGESLPHTDQQLWDVAEERINRMSNVELLQIISQVQEEQ